MICFYTQTHTKLWHELDKLNGENKETTLVLTTKIGSFQIDVLCVLFKCFNCSYFNMFYLAILIWTPEKQKSFSYAISISSPASLYNKRCFHGFSLPFLTLNHFQEQVPKTTCAARTEASPLSLTNINHITHHSLNHSVRYIRQDDVILKFRFLNILYQI